MERIKHLKLCQNCLKEGHQTISCYSGKCRVCSKSHNTLLHFDIEQKQVSLNTVNNQHVLLSTVMLYILDTKGNAHQACAPLDNASQSNCIIYAFFNKLGVKKSDINIAVTDTCNTAANFKRSCQINIKSIHTNFKTKISCLLLNHITGDIPNQSLNFSLDYLPNISLADPILINRVM